MVVMIGRITAACPVCGHTDFSCDREYPEALDVMTCGRCATKVTYVFLSRQIAEKALAESKAARESSRQRREPEKRS